MIWSRSYSWMTEMRSDRCVHDPLTSTTFSRESPSTYFSRIECSRRSRLTTKSPRWTRRRVTYVPTNPEPPMTRIRLDTTFSFLFLGLEETELVADGSLKPTSLGIRHQACMPRYAVVPVSMICQALISISLPDPIGDNGPNARGSTATAR